MDAKTFIKENVSMLSVVQAFTNQVPKNDFISCPFHNEKTASLRIYDKSFYCFGCGASGDTISFVSSLKKCNFSNALYIINYTLGLGLSTNLGKIGFQEQNKIAEKARLAKIQQEKELAKKAIYEENYNILCQTYRVINKEKESPLKKLNLNILHDVFEEYQNKEFDFDVKAFQKYLLLDHINLNQMMKEVN